MISLQGFIKNLQDKPYEIRTRILWVSTIVVGIIVVSIWILGLKNEFKNIDKQSILGTDAGTQISTTHYIKLEGSEIVSEKTLIYFTVANDTTDILNFSKSADIALHINDSKLHPAQILDRQNDPFVQKILSKTSNFGILVFDVSEVASGKLTFDNLSFENSSQTQFMEEIDFKIKDLPKPQNIRN